MDKIWKELAKPFKDDEIEWRVQRCGKANNGVWALIVPYLQARAVMDRLDEVLGVPGWSDSYSAVQTAESGIACRLTIHRGDKPSITKEDAAECTNVSPVKGGYSDALKRAAVKFGMGRYLYTVDTVFAENIQDDRINGGIHIYDKKKDINCWCPRPKLSELLSGGKRAAKKETEKPEEPTAKGDLVAEVTRLVNELLNNDEIKFTMKHRANSLEKYLKIVDMKDLPKCSEEDLALYVVNLKAFQARERAKMEKAKEKAA